MFTPRSYSTLSTKELPILQGLVKFHKSFNFYDNLLWIIVLHFSISIIIPKSFNHFFLDRMSFINLT